MSNYNSYLSVYGTLIANGTTTVSSNWGLSTDLPAPGDYDGDGKTDFSVYRPGTSGAYYILQSSSGNLQSATFGGANDVPVEKRWSLVSHKISG